MHEGCFDGSLYGNPQRIAWGHITVNTSMLHVILQAIPVLAAAGGVLYAALQFRGWRLSQYVANFTKLIELQLQIRKDDYFASWEVNMLSIAKRPAFRAMWQSDRTKILHDGFRRYMERLMQGSP